MRTSQTVELPSGVIHSRTTTVADTWENYLALSPEDGWLETQVTTDDANTVWKENEIRGHIISVFPPLYRETL